MNRKNFLRSVAALFAAPVAIAKAIEPPVTDNLPKLNVGKAGMQWLSPHAFRTHDVILTESGKQYYVGKNEMLYPINMDGGEQPIPFSELDMPAVVLCSALPES